MRLLVHQIGLKLQTERTVRGVSDVDLTRAAVFVRDQKPQIGIGGVEPVIEHVGDLVAVDGDQRFSGDDPRAKRRTAAVDRGDLGRHACAPL